MKMEKAVHISLLLIAFVVCSQGLIHHLKIVDDPRPIFKIETFGFSPYGTITFNLSSLSLHPKTRGSNHVLPVNTSVAIVARESTQDLGPFLEDESFRLDCDRLLLPLRDEAFRVLRVDLINGSQVSPITNWKWTIEKGDEAFYTIVFINCQKIPSRVSFNLDLAMYNVGPNYLSAGDAPLPTLYFFFSVIWVVVLIIWLTWYFKIFYSDSPYKRVFKIHTFITVFIILKGLSLFFRAVDYHYLKIVGTPGVWAIAYFIFAGLKGIMMFVVIALIGTGWAFVKPFLTDQDKKIFLVVIPAQVLSNIALIILEETAPGSQGWLDWKKIFKFVDLICCVAILAPIIWSIKHLREAAQIDGKAKRVLDKLKLFRQFYLLVIVYIYFTRMVVLIIETVLSYEKVWLGDFFEEFASIVFWSITCYKFKPVDDNPYLKVDDDDDDVELNEIISENQAQAVQNTEVARTND